MVSWDSQTVLASLPIFLLDQQSRIIFSSWKSKRRLVDFNQTLSATFQTLSYQTYQIIIFKLSFENFYLSQYITIMVMCCCSEKLSPRTVRSKPFDNLQNSSSLAEWQFTCSYLQASILAITNLILYKRRTQLRIKTLGAKFLKLVGNVFRLFFELIYSFFAEYFVGILTQPRIEYGRSSGLLRLENFEQGYSRTNR